MPRRIVMLGATAGIGRALARQLAERGDQLFLLGRDSDELARSAADLAIRNGHAIDVAHCDLLEPASFAPALDAACRSLGSFDTVIVSAADFATQDALEADLERAARLMTVDFTHTVIFCELARRRLMEHGGGTLCVFSSVAGERGRRPMVIYGAAKAGLSRYLEGLDHRYRLAGLRTVCVKPGFVRTRMTAGLPEPPFAADADVVARRVVRAIDRGWPEVYAPAIWGWVMCVIRNLPRAVMRRVRF
jgi:short-subunit dehydrogenase